MGRATGVLVGSGVKVGVGVIVRVGVGIGEGLGVKVKVAVTVAVGASKAVRGVAVAVGVGAGVVPGWAQAARSKAPAKAEIRRLMHMFTICPLTARCCLQGEPNQ